MRFSMTSEQYTKIDAVAQVMRPSQHHLFLVSLARKIAANAGVTRKRTVTDHVLDRLIDEALCEVRAHHWQPLTNQPSQQLGVEVTSRELDTLLARSALLQDR